MKKLTILFGIIAIVMTLGCKNERKKSATSRENMAEGTKLIEAGKDITSSTFLALSGALQEAMKSGGVDNALRYCNVNASALTDSLSKEYNAHIRRTSLKWRNPKNQPSEEEIKVLHRYEKKIKNGKMLTPELISEGERSDFYAPIILQEMCLKCHGTKEEIANYPLIKELYPNDRAFGFQQGDLRGMWSVTFYR